MHEVVDERVREVLGEWPLGQQQAVVARTLELVDYDLGVAVAAWLPALLGARERLYCEGAAGSGVLLPVGGGEGRIGLGLADQLATTRPAGVSRRSRMKEPSWTLRFASMSPVSGKDSTAPAVAE
ncbi:hypothetical protein [Geodermatophilus sp. FMUSA9-8]|uniref:hypothetical protein n=1 Tax=Geodermatophilus sp. FMUSA9-8 TaxID=3120155 RepID=UPI003008E8E8